MPIPNGPWDVEWDAGFGLEPTSVGFDYQGFNFAVLTFPGAIMHIDPTGDPNTDHQFRCWYLDGDYEVVQARIRCNWGDTGISGTAGFGTRGGIESNVWGGAVGLDEPFATLLQANQEDYVEVPNDASVFHTYTVVASLSTPKTSTLYIDDVVAASGANYFGGASPRDFFIGAASVGTSEVFDATTFDLAWIALKHGTYTPAGGSDRKWWCGVAGWGGTGSPPD